MSRIILAAILAAATLVGWFLLSIARLARQLEADETAGASPRDDAAVDDSEVVGMPTAIRGVTWGQSGPHLTFNTGLEQPRPIDWDGILSGSVVPDHGRMN